MRQILQLTMAVVTVFIVTGCATTMTVSSHVERGLDLSRYHTFDTGARPTLFPPVMPGWTRILFSTITCWALWSGVSPHEGSSRHPPDRPIY